MVCPNVLFPARGGFLGGRAKSDRSVILSLSVIFRFAENWSEVRLLEARLEGFNDDGDGVSFQLKLLISYADPRLALEDGTYRYHQVDALVAERQLWLPEPILPGFLSKLLRTSC